VRPWCSRGPPAQVIHDPGSRLRSATWLIDAALWESVGSKMSKNTTIKRDGRNPNHACTQLESSLL
jgi:hypothetical protein